MASTLRLSQLLPVLARETAAARTINSRLTDVGGPLLSGLLAGWGVALPLGAIGVMVVELGMRGGLRPAAAAAAGVATADFLYAVLAAVAGSAAASALEPHAHALRLGAAAVLALVASLGLRALRRRSDGPPSLPPARRLYFRFVALTAVNPLTVAYFAALIAGLPAVASAPAAGKAVFAAAAGVASLSWQLVLAGAGAALHRRLPASARLVTALAGNALVLGLSVHLALAA
jgi:threonine/homoserine/homoserine lactone efflux protein